MEAWKETVSPLVDVQPSIPPHPSIPSSPKLSADGLLSCLLCKDGSENDLVNKHMR